MSVYPLSSGEAAPINGEGFLDPVAAAKVLGGGGCWEIGEGEEGVGDGFGGVGFEKESVLAGLYELEAAADGVGEDGEAAGEGFHGADGHAFAGGGEDKGVGEVEPGEDVGLIAGPADGGMGFESLKFGGGESGGVLGVWIANDEEAEGGVLAVGVEEGADEEGEAFEGDEASGVDEDGVFGGVAVFSASGETLFRGGSGGIEKAVGTAKAGAVLLLNAGACDGREGGLEGAEVVGCEDPDVVKAAGGAGFGEFEEAGLGAGEGGEEETLEGSVPSCGVAGEGAAEGGGENGGGKVGVDEVGFPGVDDPGEFPGGAEVVDGVGSAGEGEVLTAGVGFTGNTEGALLGAAEDEDLMAFGLQGFAEFSEKAMIAVQDGDDLEDFHRRPQAGWIRDKRPLRGLDKRPLRGLDKRQRSCLDKRSLRELDKRPQAGWISGSGAAWISARCAGWISAHFVSWIRDKQPLRGLDKGCAFGAEMGFDLDYD